MAEDARLALELSFLSAFSGLILMLTLTTYEWQVAETLPKELNDKQAALAKLEKARLEPQKTKEDMVRMALDLGGGVTVREVLGPRSRNAEE